MFNKFKIGQRVCVNGPGKKDDKYYTNKIGKVVEKDNYFCDYLIKFQDGTSDWIDEIYLKSIRKYKRKGKK